MILFFVILLINFLLIGIVLNQIKTKSIICISILLLLCMFESQSQTEPFNSGNINLLTDFGFRSSASYYAANGNNVIELIDTNRKENNIYTFDLKNFIFDFGFRYALTDELQLQFNIPLNYSTLDEIYLKDTNVASTSYGQRTTKAKLSYFLPEQYKFNLMYHLLKGKFNTFLKAGINIPAKLKNGKQNDGDFQYFSSYQFLFGLISNLIINGDWLEASVDYYIRTGVFSDELKIHLEGGFSSVPDTKLVGMIDYLLNVEKIDPNGIFDIRQNPFNENSLYLGAEFFIKLHKKIETSISYKVSVLGRNSWSIGIFGLKANFFF